jgi:hypothetical protein
VCREQLEAANLGFECCYRISKSTAMNGYGRTGETGELKAADIRKANEAVPEIAPQQPALMTVRGDPNMDLYVSAKGPVLYQFDLGVARAGL